MKPDFSDVTKTVGLTQTLAVRSGEIYVLSGSDAGRIVRIDSPTFAIGSGPNAQLRLSDVGVSREHVRLATLPEGVLVQDANSKNGTWIGTMRVDRAILSANATLTVGDVTLEVRVDAGPTALTISSATRFGAAVGFSAAMRSVFAYLEKAAAADVTVLFEGENGVGKEILASAVHAVSPRAAQPFVTVDCGAIPESLLESELFGHERGAFTGADRPKVGLFQQADGGTLFLDEVGELPVNLQPKLLRALELREVRPVGSNVARPVDIRIVAATNRNLRDQIARGSFREDLFYRLAVARVGVPALRERSEDVVPLATSLLREITNDAEVELPREVAAMFLAHTWPGNVRELKNAVRRFALLGARDQNELFEGSMGTVRDGVEAFEDLSDLPLHEARQKVIDKLESHYFPAVLAKSGGNVSRAAEHAKIARSSFYRILERVRGDGSSSSED